MFVWEYSFLSCDQKPVQSYFENTCHTSRHMHALCLFTSSRGHTLHLHLPTSHTDLMQTIKMEELLIPLGWNTDISCYPLPRQVLTAVLVSCVRWQKPTKLLPLPSTVSLTLSQTLCSPSWSDTIPHGRSGLFSPRRLKITNFMFWPSQVMSQLYHTSFQGRKFGDFVILEMKELNRGVRGTVAASTHATISISHASNTWETELI